MEEKVISLSIKNGDPFKSQTVRFLNIDLETAAGFGNDFGVRIEVLVPVTCSYPEILEYLKNKPFQIKKVEQSTEKTEQLLLPLISVDRTGKPIGHLFELKNKVVGVIEQNILLDQFNVGLSMMVLPNTTTRLNFYLQ